MTKSQPISIHFLMYGVYLFLFGMNVHIVNEPPYHELNNCLEYNIKEELKISIEHIEYLRSLSEKHGREYIKQYYCEALEMHNSILSLLQYLDSIKSETTKNKQYITDSVAGSIITYLCNEQDTILNTVRDPGAVRAFKEILPGYYMLHLEPDNRDRSFLKHILYNTPSSLTMSVIDAIQNLIVRSENIITNELCREQNGCIATFDNYKPIAIVKNTYTFPGQKVQADIFWSEYNTTLQPMVIASSGKLKPPVEGVSAWEAIATKPGHNQVSGKLTVLWDSRLITHSWSFQYYVYKNTNPKCAIRMDKMNTCYIGISNPISISVAGYETKDLDLSISNAIVHKLSDGHYEIVTDKKTPQKIYAYVTVKNTQGRTDTLDGIELRVKELPIPIALLGGKNCGSIGLQELMKEKGIVVQQQDTDIAMRYSVVSYSLGIMQPAEKKFIGPYDVHGAAYANEAAIQTALSQAKAGDHVILWDIIAKDANNRTIEVPSISLQIE